MQRIIPPITIIVPVYNARPFLPKLIESILGQTVPCSQCIFVDDGSADESYDYLLSIAKQHKHFSVMKTLHGGVSSARNFALAVLPDDGYSAFIDADDYIDSDYLEYFAMHLTRGGEGCLHHGLGQPADAREWGRLPNFACAAQSASWPNKENNSKSAPEAVTV